MGLDDEIRLYSHFDGSTGLFIPVDLLRTNQQAINTFLAGANVTALLGQIIGTPALKKFFGITTGALQELIKFTTAATGTTRLHRVVVTCRHKGVYKIKSAGTVIGSGRTGASAMNSKFRWVPAFNVPISTEVIVEYTGDGPETDIEAYLMASDI